MSITTSKPKAPSTQNDKERTEYDLQQYLQGLKACRIIPPDDIFRCAMNEFHHILTIETIVGLLADQGLTVDELTVQSYQAIYGSFLHEKEDEPAEQ